MADAAQYTFSYEEVATALIKQLDINEGLWALNVNFSFSAKSFRKEASNPAMSPGFYGILEHIGLIRVAKSISGLTVDAARVNPKLTRRPGTKLN
jgi:hypothetical protein